MGRRFSPAYPFFPSAYLLPTEALAHIREPLAMSQPSNERTIYQPLHPDMIPRLDPKYVEFHNSVMQYFPPIEKMPWNPAIRNAPPLPGGTPPLEVGATKDFALSHARVRTFTPQGTAPEQGWPVLLWFHGGGWRHGNISSETSFCTNMCERAKCVVVSVDYRLSPENLHPVPIEDAVDALQWVVKTGCSELSLDVSRIAVGGASAGGHIAAVLALKAVELNITPIVFQLLLIPTTDATANTDSEVYPSWSELPNAPFLPPHRVLWFRKEYIPDEEDWKRWDASPILAPEELFKKAPPAWIGVAEIDVMRDEGVRYGDRLKKHGIPAETKIYPKVPHIFPLLDAQLYHSLSLPLCHGRATGILTAGAEAVTDAASALGKAFGTV